MGQTRYNRIESRTHNSSYPKGGVSCSKDSFVGNQTLVFQIKFCGRSLALRVAAKRYGQVKKKTYRKARININFALLIKHLQLTRTKIKS